MKSLSNNTYALLYQIVRHKDIDPDIDSDIGSLELNILMKLQDRNLLREHGKYPGLWNWDFDALENLPFEELQTLKNELDRLDK